MSVAALERTLEQRLAALERANEIRTRRAQLKRDVRAGIPFMALVWEPPDWLLTMQVYDLLLAVPKLGKRKAEQIMRRLRISHQKTVGGLSERQRVDLLSELGRRGAS